MKKVTTPEAPTQPGIVEDAWEKVRVSFARLCLRAGEGTLTPMMEQDAAVLSGLRHGRAADKLGQRWSSM
jgi:hypothetical protein